MGERPGRAKGARRGTHRRERRPAQVLLLREEPEAGQEADRRPRRLHLRRVHRPVQRDHRGGAERGLRGDVGRPAQAARDLRVPRPVRHRPGHRQEVAVRRRLQPLQARAGRDHRLRARQGRARRARQVEHPAARPHRLRQDAARADAGPHAQRAVRHRRRHRADGGRLRRRGRREHPAQADPGRRLRRQARRDRDHLHRRDRQGRAQEREPVDHPRRLRRGRAAGAAEDPRGHHRVGAAAGRPQAPAPGVHPDRHHQRAVHRRRRLRRPRHDRRAAAGPEAPRLHLRHRRRRARRTRTPTPTTSSATSCPRTC